MDTDNITNPNKITMEQSYDGNVNENLEKRITDAIVALVNKANAIAVENEVIEKPQLYKDVKDATTYISDTEEKAGDARTKYNELKEMPKAHFWTIGRNKAKVEKTQDVLLDVIDAIDNNANASKALFNNQVKMTEKVKELYAISLMGVAANRMVVREIKSRLERASKEELSQLARQELENVIYELKLQQRIMEKVDNVETKLNEAINKHDQLAEHVDNVETKINETINKHDQLSEHVDGVEKKLNEADENYHQKTLQIEESINRLKSNSDNHDRRLDLLERKSFFDSKIYKIGIGVIAIAALVCSLVL